MLYMCAHCTCQKMNPTRVCLLQVLREYTNSVPVGHTATFAHASCHCECLGQALVNSVWGTLHCFEAKPCCFWDVCFVHLLCIVDNQQKPLLGVSVGVVSIQLQCVGSGAKFQSATGLCVNGVKHRLSLVCQRRWSHQQGICQPHVHAWCFLSRATPSLLMCKAGELVAHGRLSARLGCSRRTRQAQPAAC